MMFFDVVQLMLAGIVVLAWSVKVLLLLGNGINPFSLGAKTRGPARWVERLLPLWVFLWLWLILGYALHWRAPLLPGVFQYRVVDAEVVKIVGLVLAAAGVLLLILALAHLRESYRFGIGDPDVIVREGVYAFTRNPIFLALDLYCLGTFLLNGTAALLVLSAVEIVLVHRQILREERFLQARFGDAYSVYCAETPRYWGKVRTPPNHRPGPMPT
jgi:protein-S-isoprenylcysteine O-methyltransferase Ste14